MITRLETLYYRCLRHIDQRLSPRQVVAGPNASGKTSFLDAIAFLGDLVRDGLDAAVYARAPDVRDLIWRRRPDRFELAIELPVPELEGHLFADRPPAHCRYEVAIGLAEQSGEAAILAERVLLLTDALREEPAGVQEALFPMDAPPPQTLANPRERGVKTIVHKVPGGHDKFYDETGAGWDPSFKLGHRRSALANLPEDETRFPVATWLKDMLTTGIHRLHLDNARMRRPSPPGSARTLCADGGNLPWIIARMEADAPAFYVAWIDLLRTVLPGLDGVRTVERPEDRHRYVAVRDAQGMDMPSWMVSDGTLRLLALTALAYAPDAEGVYLIEEPENGLHAGALEMVFQALGASRAQVLMTTHSPVLKSLAGAEDLICLVPSDAGATAVVAD